MSSVWSMCDGEMARSEIVHGSGCKGEGGGGGLWRILLLGMRIR